jgi:hypothetical protein
MILLAASLALVVLLAVALERRGRRRRQHNDLRHITGARPWWGQGA